jgi:hypothetical protein
MTQRCNAGFSRRKPMTIRSSNFRADALAAVLVLLAPNAAFPACRGLSPEQQPIAALEEHVAAQGIRISAWLDRPDAAYQPGDALTLFVKATKDAYITVLDTGTSGKVHVVFPNKYQTDNRVQAHEIVQIPGGESGFRLTVNGPAGKEVLKIFATEKAIDYLDVKRLGEAGAYYTVPGDARAIARDLGAELGERDRAGYGVFTQMLSIGSESGDACSLPDPH